MATGNSRQKSAKPSNRLDAKRLQSRLRLIALNRRRQQKCRLRLRIAAEKAEKERIEASASPQRRLKRNESKQSASLQQRRKQSIAAQEAEAKRIAAEKAEADRLAITGAGCRTLQAADDSEAVHDAEPPMNQEASIRSQMRQM